MMYIVHVHSYCIRALPFDERQKPSDVMLEYSIGNGQLSDVTCSAHEIGRYLASEESSKITINAHTTSCPLPMEYSKQISQTQAFQAGFC